MYSAYSDIIQRQRPLPLQPRMPRLNRAKLFHPYDALKPFEETIHAKDEVYVRRMELSEYAQERLDRKLRRLRRGSQATVIWFQPKRDADDLGKYLTSSGVITRIDMVHHKLLLGKCAIRISDIIEIGE